MNIYFDSQMSDGARRRGLYDGSIFVHASCPSAVKLCKLAQEMVEEAFQPLDPRRVQETMPVEHESVNRG